MRRVKNLPFKITKFDGKKETILELEKSMKILAFNLEIRNMLKEKIYGKVN
jgi:hypothetical protein